MLMKECRRLRAVVLWFQIGTIAGLALNILAQLFNMSLLFPGTQIFSIRPLNLTQILTPYFTVINFKTVILSRICFKCSKVSLTFRFPYQNVAECLISHMLATCAAYKSCLFLKFDAEYFYILRESPLHMTFNQPTAKRARNVHKKTASVVPPDDGCLTPETCRRHNKVIVKVKMY
jgi:hypothetical protein